MRLTEHEDAAMQALADAHPHVSRADIARLVLFDAPLPTPVQPCSSAHPRCTQHHADLVRGYRDESEREALNIEALTGNYPGDIEHWKATGGTRLTFARWLRAHTYPEEQPHG